MSTRRSRTETSTNPEATESYSLRSIDLRGLITSVVALNHIGDSHAILILTSQFVAVFSICTSIVAPRITV